MFLIGSSSTYAQIGELGIYGSVPEEDAENIYHVYLQDLYPTFESDVDHFLPVNGLKNFNFYYLPGGVGFIPAGTYRVHYFAANKTTSYGYDQVSYSPNGGHTNGVEVRSFNGSLTSPLGIHGIIRARVPGGGGTTVPLENAIASVGSGNLHKATTNGAGYFSIYYSSIYGADGGFLPNSAVYYTRISGTYDGCPYLWDDPLGSIYILSGGPSDPEYYVEGAESDIGTVTLSSTSPGACQP